MAMNAMGFSTTVPTDSKHAMTAEVQRRPKEANSSQVSLIGKVWVIEGKMGRFLRVGGWLTFEVGEGTTE